MSRADDSLKRLVESGLCNCCDPSEYMGELKALAREKADSISAKRRGDYFKALGDESRQRLIGLLSVREMCVCELMSALEMTQPTTSHHLKILEAANVVKSRKDGKWVFYSLADMSLLNKTSLLIN